MRPGKARALLARYRDAFPIDYREVYPPRSRSAIFAYARSADAGASARRRILSPARRGRGARRAESVQPQPADLALRARAGAGKHGFPRRRRAHLSHSAAETSRKSGFTTWSSKARRASRSTLRRCEQRLEACFLVVMGRKAESDGYNALVLATGLGWRDVALIRTISRFLRQIRVPYSQDYMWATLRKHARHRGARSWRCSTRGSIRTSSIADERARGARGRDRRRDRNRTAGGREPR